MTKHLVISLNRSAIRVQLDAVAAENSDRAMERIAQIRTTSDVIIALTPDQLEAYAIAVKASSCATIENNLLLATVDEQALSTI